MGPTEFDERELFSDGSNSGNNNNGTDSTQVNIPEIDVTCPEGGITPKPAPEDLYKDLQLRTMPKVNATPSSCLEDDGITPREYECEYQIAEDPGTYCIKVDTGCNETVNLKRNPLSKLDKDLNYLSDWFYDNSQIKTLENGRLVTNSENPDDWTFRENLVQKWNYNLVPKNSDINLEKINSVTVRLFNGSDWSEWKTVNKCSDEYYLKFNTKFENAKLEVLIKTMNFTNTYKYGPFYVGNAWYVRPQKAVGYGTGDGKSYDNAFSGLISLDDLQKDDPTKTNLDLIVPGDTVFITGLQLHEIVGPKINRIPGYYIKLTKNSVELNNPDVNKNIAYRGDYPGDKGVVWGAAKISSDFNCTENDGPYFNWIDEGDGIWSIDLESFRLGNYGGDSSYLFQDIGDGSKLAHKTLSEIYTNYEDLNNFDPVKRDELTESMKKELLDNLKANPGSYFAERKLYPDNIRRIYKLYVKLTDSGCPTGRISLPFMGYQFLNKTKFDSDGKVILAGRYENITYKALTFQNLVTFTQGYSGGSHLSYIRWKGCKYTYHAADRTAFDVFYDSDHVEITDTEHSCVGNGFYSMNWDDDRPPGVTVNDTLKHYYFKNDYFHDIGIRKKNQNNDSHCIAFQGSSYGFVEDTSCIRAGSGPAFGTQMGQDGKENIIRRTFTKDTHTCRFRKQGMAYKNIIPGQGFGFAISQNFDISSDIRGNKAYCNLVENTRYGIISNLEQNKNFKNIPEIYNNILYDTEDAFHGNYVTAGDTNYGSLIFKNNKMYKTEWRHINLFINNDNYMFDFSGNVYHPSYKQFLLGITANDIFRFVCTSSDCKTWPDPNHLKEGSIFDNDPKNPSRVAQDGEGERVVTKAYEMLNVPEELRTDFGVEPDEDNAWWDVCFVSASSTPRIN